MCLAVMKRVLSDFAGSLVCTALCAEAYDMQISEPAGGVPAEAEPCRFPKLEECAHFHYERVQLPRLALTLQSNADRSLHSQHESDQDDSSDWHTVQVTSADECWLVRRSYENFKMLDAQLHRCIFDRKISRLPDLSARPSYGEDVETLLGEYLSRFSRIADNSLNCGPVLNWFQMDNKGHRLLVPSEESRSINTPAVAAAYSVRRYVSQARDELNLEVGDMISVIDMASPAESVWWRGKRGFQVGFFPQHCVHIIGDKVPRNMPLPPPVVGSLAVTPVKPVLRKHGKLIAFFRSFILNRPSRRRLKQSGILKERVFGCDLGEHLLNSGHDVPTVLKCCSEFIEKHGIVDGIYRLSGVTSNIQKLRNAFDEDRVPDLYTEDILQDIHSVASLLKMYFRELPNPLCTYQLYQSFVNAVQGCNNVNRNSLSDHDRLLRMREAVQKLPPPHYRTLEYLMRHLSRVANHGSSTGMTTRNVAIVWAPNLLRCAELEVGGVAALQGVGVQAVVTEFLICYADLIFCDHLPTSDGDDPSSMSPKRCRPKSLAISTPTKLITLEEARTKHSLNRVDDGGYIEVGGGPDNLPKKYHTIIELPAGSRKRNLSKRSPLGWRSFFSKSRNSSRSQGSLTKNRKASTPGNIAAEKCGAELDMSNIKRKLRPVKSAESLTSGHSEPATAEDVLGPLHSLNKPPGHNRSVSHDSYFDLLQNSQPNSEGSLYDLSEIQLNFDLEESEMRMFSEDESLVSSPRVQKDAAQKRILTRARPEEFNSFNNSNNPSPKKQARVVLSPDYNSRKRSRIEDQLSDIQYIDCNTPENACIISTTAMVHSQQDASSFAELYRPRSKASRNQESSDKRQSLDLEKCTKPNISKSLTETNLQRGGGELLLPSTRSSLLASPQSPLYKRFDNVSSSNTTPDVGTPLEVEYRSLNCNSSPNRRSLDDKNEKSTYHAVVSPITKKSSPTYENVLTTISITYKSPDKTAKSTSAQTPTDDDYESVLLNPEQAIIPTSLASLPLQQASQPHLDFCQNSLPSNLTASHLSEKSTLERRPKSLSALENNFLATKTSISLPTHIDATCNAETGLNFVVSTTTINQRSPVTSTYKLIDNADQLSLTDLSLSEVLHSSTENLDSSHSSITFPDNASMSPNVSPMLCDKTAKTLSQEILNSLSPSTVDLLETRTAITHGMSASLSSTDLKFNDISVQDAHLYEGLHDDSEYFKLPHDEECRSPTADMDCEETNTSDTKNDVLDFTLSETCANESRADCVALECDDSIDKDVQFICDDFETTINNSKVQREESNWSEIITESICEENVTDDQEKCVKTQSIEDDELDIYQQVKYFRRSIHEINALLDLQEPLEKSKDKASNEALSQSMDDAASNAGSESLDSLEIDGVPIYENFKEPTQEVVTKDERHDYLRPKATVKSLTSHFEMRQFGFAEKPPLPIFRRSDSQKSNRLKLAQNEHGNDVAEKCKVIPKVIYDRDGLPPCLRARHLKNSVKTRSLDEEEFAQQCGPQRAAERRKSMDENFGSKFSPLPKLLNKPKPIPMEGEKMELHLAHSSENVNASHTSLPEHKLNRERIEKYKEERRKVLHEKYRSESFREDKDSLLSRLKQKGSTKGGEEIISRTKGDCELDVDRKLGQLADFDKVSRRKSSEDASMGEFRDSIRCRTALFESQLGHSKPRINDTIDVGAKKIRQDVKIGKVVGDGNEDNLRNSGRRLDDNCRHSAFESRERDSEVDAASINRRTKSENKHLRKEAKSPSYCIKDMKALFESKSQQ